MPVNRLLWEAPLAGVNAPNWHCPSCTGGYLRLSPKGLLSAMTAASEQARDHEAWDPTWSTLAFVALLHCDNAKCNERVTVAGSGKVIEDFRNGRDDDVGYDWVELFYPSYVYPSPHIIPIPEKCPPEVADQIRRAFVASWGDFESSANRIRVALELLMDALGIPRTHIDKKTKERKDSSLHFRIQRFAKKDKYLSDLLLAAKWLGNAGSHAGELTRSDVFDALDLLHYVLEELYVRDKNGLAKLAKSINRRRGPARKQAAKG